MRAQHSYNARKSHSHRITVQYANTQHSHCAADTRKRQSRADSRKARRLLDVSARVRMCVLLRTHNRGVPIGDCGWSNTLRQAHCCTANSGTLAFGVDLTARGARAFTRHDVGISYRARARHSRCSESAGWSSRQICDISAAVHRSPGRWRRKPRAAATGPATGPSRTNRSVRARHDASGHASQASPC